MSDLTPTETRKLERLLQMGGGYVLNFSNRTFEDFVLGAVRREIYDEGYAYSGGSKANRLRAFWTKENNHLVGTLLGELIEYGCAEGLIPPDHLYLAPCRQTVSRLRDGSALPDLEALCQPGEQEDLDFVAAAVRKTIEENRPEEALDRLHTYTIKYLRALCAKHSLAVGVDKPLHSLFGEYVKKMKSDGHIESEMAQRILKSSISTLESFNHVRNQHSLAHDNPILNYDEALLICSHVTSSIRYLRALESRVNGF